MRTGARRRGLRLMLACWALLPAGALAVAAAQTEPLVIAGAGGEAAERAEQDAAADAEIEAPLAPEELFVSANRAYDDGDYARSAALYRRLIERGHGNGHLHYNLGNAELRNGELGRAIASYRRGRALMPRDREVQANLEFARKSTKDAIAPPEPPSSLVTLFFWHYELSVRELATLTLVLNLLFWIGHAVQLRWRRREALRWALIALLVPLLGVAGSLAVHLAAPTRVAVIVPQEADARTGPDAASVVRFKLHAGTEVRLREVGDGWVRIALPDGQQGWIESRQVETVVGT